jgi:hypothetical protein
MSEPYDTERYNTTKATAEVLADAIVRVTYTLKQLERESHVSIANLLFNRIWLEKFDTHPSPEDFEDFRKVVEHLAVKF